MTTRGVAEGGSGGGASSAAGGMPRALEAAAWGFAALLGAVVVLAGAVGELPVVLLPLGVGAAAGGALVLWNTRIGLTFIGFAVGPLGILQAEVAGVTLNLPEVLILALFAKTAVALALRQEWPEHAIPWWPFIAYFVASLLGVLTGLLRGNPIVDILQDFRQFTEYLVLYFVVIAYVRTRREVIGILLAFVLGCWLLAVHGIVQQYVSIGIPGMQQLSDQILHEGVRSGSFYGATPLGAIMVLGLGPALGLMLTTPRRGAQALMALIALTLVVGAVYTKTRASWMAILILLVVLFIAVRKTPAMLAFTGAASVAMMAVFGPLIVARLADLEISKSERSLMERVQYYTAAWHIFREDPLLGLGWGCYFDIKTILTNNRFVPVHVPQRPLHLGPVEPTVHSAYLQLLVRAGLLGVAAFFAVLWKWFRLIWKEWRDKDRRAARNEADHNLFAGVGAALFGYLFHSGLENFFQWPVMAQAFWMLIGLSVVMGGQLLTGGRLPRTRAEALEPAPASGAPTPAGA